MSKFVTATALAVALLIGMGIESKAGSWCASYHEGGGGCGFASQQQCLDEVRGIGGICVPNYRDELHRYRTY